MPNWYEQGPFESFLAPQYLFSYYKVARKRFVDSICMQVANDFLVDGPKTPYRDRGYKTPEESMASIINTPAPSDLVSKRSDKPGNAKGQTRIQAKDSKFDDALQGRNIATEGTADPELSSYKQTILTNYHSDLPPDPSKEEPKWQKDLQKSKGSNEAIF